MRRGRSVAWKGIGHMVSEEMIREVVERLKRAAPDSTIILFGSYARGDARQRSDLDFLVVEPVVTERRREMVRLDDEVQDLDIEADILVVSRRAFDEWADTPGTVIYVAAKEGKVLHAGADSLRVAAGEGGTG